MTRAAISVSSYVNSERAVVFFFKQKTAYEMRISDWSSDVCSSDLLLDPCLHLAFRQGALEAVDRLAVAEGIDRGNRLDLELLRQLRAAVDRKSVVEGKSVAVRVDLGGRRLIKNTHQ